VILGKVDVLGIETYVSSKLLTVRQNGIKFYYAGRSEVEEITLNAVYYGTACHGGVVNKAGYGFINAPFQIVILYFSAMNVIYNEFARQGIAYVIVIF
jgi:hypothetical protein